MAAWESKPLRVRKQQNVAVRDTPIVSILDKDLSQSLLVQSQLTLEGAIQMTGNSEGIKAQLHGRGPSKGSRKQQRSHGSPDIPKGGGDGHSQPTGTSAAPHKPSL